MRGRPFANQSLGGSRRNVAGEKISAEIECRFLSAMLRMKVRRWMIAKVHANNDSKKVEMMGMRFVNYFAASVL